jgi:hypothetical protein
VNPSFADPPPHDHGKKGDDPSGLTYTIDLNGPDSLRGAFEFVGSGTATLDKKGILKGVDSVDMERPGTTVGCTTPEEQGACMVWNDVFNLCGLLDPIPNFTVLGGDWEVSTGSFVFVGFGFELESPLSPDNPLSVSLALAGTCSPSPCEIIPVVGDPKVIPLTLYSIHLKGKGGVTHNADCHASLDYPMPISLGGVHGSTLVITAP